MLNFIIGFSLAALLIACVFPWRGRLRGPIRVTALWIYPIKSCAGIKIDEKSSVSVDRLGFRHDRRWLIVDDNGKFITQRQVAGMVLIQPSIDESAGVMRLNAPNMPQIQVPLTLANDTTAAEIEVAVWGDKMHAKVYGEQYGSTAWLTKYMGVPARLVTVISTDEHKRAINKLWDVGRTEDRINNAFSDAAPFLLTSEPSLADLNRKIRAHTKGEAAPVVMHAFRPNIVVNAPGLQAWDEDGWRNIRVGPQDFIAVRPCSRCTIPTIDTTSAKKSPFGEPLQTLRRYRKLVDDSVYFGQHLVQLSIGEKISVGDVVQVLSRKPAALEKSAVPPPKPKTT